MQKPSDTRWLARVRAVRAVRMSLAALVTTFEHIHDESGDAEAHGITVAVMYLLSDVMHIMAKVQSSMQNMEIDLASVPSMVNVTIKHLNEIHGHISTSTWFKNHYPVFSNMDQLLDRNIEVTKEEKSRFIEKVYKPYIQSVVDHISERMKSTDLISSIVIFDPRHLPASQKELSQSDYGTVKTMLCSHSLLFLIVNH